MDVVRGKGKGMGYVSDVVRVVHLAKIRVTVMNRVVDR